MPQPNKIRVVKSRRLRWAGHVAWLEKAGSAFKVVTCKPTEKRPLERPKHVWEESIGIDLKEIGVNTRIGFIKPSIEIIGDILGMQY